MRKKEPVCGHFKRFQPNSGSIEGGGAGDKENN